MDNQVSPPPRPTPEPTYHKNFYTPMPQYVAPRKVQFETQRYVPHPYHPTPHPFITGAGRWGTGVYGTPKPTIIYTKSVEPTSPPIPYFLLGLLSGFLFSALFIIVAAKIFPHRRQP